jgi:hypothetical protein
MLLRKRLGEREMQIEADADVDAKRRRAARQGGGR